MNILFANGRRLPPLSVGGDTILIRNLFKYITKQGHNCLAIGTIEHPSCINYKDNIKELLKQNKIKYQQRLVFKINLKQPQKTIAKTINYQYFYPSLLVNKTLLINKFKYVLNKFNPDVVITQLENALDIIKISLRNKIPVILYIQDVEKKTINIFTKLRNWQHLNVICISKFAKNKLKNKIKCPIKVINTSLDPSRCLLKEKCQKKYVTMINPVAEKGGKLLYKIIKQTPEINYKIVEGWKKFEDINYKFDSFRNVKLMRRQTDIRQVFKQTKILLVPSIWQECFGRVVIEAGLNGIPSLVSDKGGLKEAIGKGGIVISENKTNVWIKAIKKLLTNKKEYSKSSKLAKQNAKKFLMNKVCKKNLELITKIGKQK